VKEINLSYLPTFNLVPVPLTNGGCFAFGYLSDLSAVKINLETYTKLPQTLSIFIPQAIVYDFLYKLIVMTCLSCMAYIGIIYLWQRVPGHLSTTSILWKTNP